MFGRQDLQPSNQTEFVDQAQFLEKQSTSLLNLRNLKRNKNLLPFIILVVLILLFLILVTLKALLPSNSTETEKTEEVKQEMQTDPLQLRVNELQESLKAHNPTKQSLPFPQVDLEFNIN
jgi:cell division protein FtsX